MQAFGRVLRGVREYRRLDNKQAAEAVGLSAGTITAIERGSLPNMQNFLRICRWIGIKPSAFLDDEGDIPATQTTADPVAVDGFEHLDPGGDIQ
jgi:transcriptional regulator with XRE-family HTH domain